uniref:G-protein coupled receptors family 1 profile domain-containing protein n=1 Tax=Plectus sambesii TaxID=2011161 RepID=A0A914XB60_9BILA
MNNTSHAGAARDEGLSGLWAALFGTLFSSLTIIGLLGNTIVIVAIGGDRKMRRSVMNLLLLNLALADELNLITTAVEWVQPIVNGSPVWFVPNFLCAPVRYLECVFLYTSILTQLTVCIERFIAIVYPMQARQLCTRTKILVIVGCIWVFSFAFASPYAYLHDTTEIRTPSSQNMTLCVMKITNAKLWICFKWIECLTFYFLPLLAFIAFYLKVAKVLWSKNKQLHASNNPQGVSDSQAETLKVRRSVVKMLVACVAVYFLCYSPIQAIFLSKALFQLQVAMPYVLIMMLNALAVACSACNPLLYTLFSRRFRVKFAELLRCREQTPKKASKSDAPSFATSRTPSRNMLVVVTTKHGLSTDVAAFPTRSDDSNAALLNDSCMTQSTTNQSLNYPRSPRLSVDHSHSAVNK